MAVCLRYQVAVRLRYKMLATPLPIRQQIVRLRHKDNLSIGTIANIVKKSKSVIHGILKAYDDTGSCEAGKSIGRPRKTSERDDRAIAKLMKADSVKTAAAVSREFNAIMKNGKRCISVMNQSLICLGLIAGGTFVEE